MGAYVLTSSTPSQQSLSLQPFVEIVLKNEGIKYS